MHLMSLSELQTVEDKPIHRSQPGRIQGKLKKALDLMVFQGLWFVEASKQVGLLPQAMRKALEKPHVISYLREQKQVFRASVSSQNIFKLADIRDNADNAMAQLGAIKVLEQIDGDVKANQQSNQPGFVIVIASNAPVSVSKTIDTTLNDSSK